jgi:hypothetical protein
MIYKCKTIEPHSSYWQKAMSFFGLNGKPNGVQTLKQAIRSNAESEFGENTNISKAMANLNGNANKEIEAMNPSDLLSEAERNALLAFDEDEEQNTEIEEVDHIKKLTQIENSNFTPSINDKYLRAALVDFILTGNRYYLKKEEIEDAIDDLKRIPLNKNLIKIVRGDIRKELVKVLIDHDISETDDFFRGKLIELLESLLK